MSYFQPSGAVVLRYVIFVSFLHSNTFRFNIQVIAIKYTSVNFFFNHRQGCTFTFIPYTGTLLHTQSPMQLQTLTLKTFTPKIPVHLYSLAAAASRFFISLLPPFKLFLPSSSPIILLFPLQLVQFAG